MSGLISKALLVPVVFSAVLSWISVAAGQEMGAEAEMDRLELRAEELIAQGDADGASLMIGKAAMMASELAKRERNHAVRRLHEETQKIFRAQEQAYRAVALFERAGGVPPASSGVCHALHQAGKHFQASHRRLQTHKLDSNEQESVQVKSRLAVAKDWVLTVQELRQDFGCPP